MWWLCLIRSRFRTITWAVKGSPDYFHHPYNPLSWLILCCLCPCSPTREDMGFFSTSWLHWSSLPLSFPLGPGGEAASPLPSSLRLLFPWHRSAHLCKTLPGLLGQGCSECVTWEGPCCPDEPEWARLCAGRAGSVSYRLVWSHGQSAVWEHAISWLSGLLQMASQKKILFRSGTHK